MLVQPNKRTNRAGGACAYILLKISIARPIVINLTKYINCCAITEKMQMISYHY